MHCVVVFLKSSQSLKFLWILILFSSEAFILYSLYVIASPGQQQAVAGTLLLVLMDIISVLDIEIKARVLSMCTQEGLQFM